ncbi:MAG: rRNA pseudouridine synthase, partial [Anaerolineae bacterium]|nr:rRNA pseudouridine synthase [Anaerolineae bacterium]
MVIHMARERLQKLLALAGFGSRRACETLITQRRVQINGKLAELGMSADPAVDEIRVDGERLRLTRDYVYIALNKPRDVISDEDVGGNWPAARELIPLEGHLYPVGRLDVESEGLMLFTNDGDLAHRLT